MEGRKERELTSSEYSYVMFLPWPILGAFFLERGGGGWRGWGLAFHILRHQLKPLIGLFIYQNCFNFVNLPSEIHTHCRTKMPRIAVVGD